MSLLSHSSRTSCIELLTFLQLKVDSVSLNVGLHDAHQNIKTVMKTTIFWAHHPPEWRHTAPHSFGWKGERIERTRETKKEVDNKHH